MDTETSTCGITCLDTFDFIGDGKPELIIGRRDGTVQVFTMKSESDFEEIDPQQLYCNVRNGLLMMNSVDFNTPIVIEFQRKYFCGSLRVLWFPRFSGSNRVHVQWKSLRSVNAVDCSHGHWND